MNAIVALKGIDLSSTHDLLITEGGMDSRSALEAIDLYRKFLELKIKYKGAPLVPSKLIDAAWHFHILDTRKYVGDCQNLFGEYMHHDPFPDPGLKATAWQKTKELFLAEFGVDINKTADGSNAEGRCV